MRTQIYEHRSGLKVVPRDIVSDVEKILWDINPILSKRTVASIKESVREKDWKKRDGQVNIAWIHPLELQFRLI